VLQFIRLRPGRSGWGRLPSKLIKDLGIVGNILIFAKLKNVPEGLPDFVYKFLQGTSIRD
jgi:hypothetical protein